MQFELRPEARWHDGVAVTPADVIWTFNTLIEEGAPFYRAYYGNVSEVAQVGDHGVKFSFDVCITLAIFIKFFLSFMSYT